MFVVDGVDEVGGHLARVGEVGSHFASVGRHREVGVFIVAANGRSAPEILLNEK